MRLIKGIFKLIGFIMKLVFETVIFFALLGLCLFGYARYVEPQLINIHEEKIMAAALKDTDGLIIVQFSDTHLGGNYTLKNLRKVIQRINKANPDIIVFSGDLIDDNANFKDEETVINELKGLKAKYCKVAVYGNHDHGGNGTKRYKRIMEGAGFVLLNNSSYAVKVEDNKKVNIMGIDDMLLGNPDIQKALKSIKPGDYNLFLSHAPDAADLVKKFPIDLQLSGHSHGGQVALPFIGAPFTPPYAKKYVKGMYTFEGNERMKLYVNCGLGTSQVNYRFLNIPEITVFKVQTQ